MDANDSGEVSGPMSVDSEHLPNGDDSAFVSDHHSAPASGGTNSPVENHQDHEGGVVPVALSGDVSGTPIEHVRFVATSQGLLTAEHLDQNNSESDSPVKTTHIVIHDQTLDEQHEGEIIAISATDPGLRTPTTPLPPPTPATPLSRERGFKYQWDESVYSLVLPVRCKSSNGELYKTRFGSGGRGRCIRMKDHWYTPSEFEAVCGRASSKDWKRSIRYGGRTLQCLIEDGILQPHATSCTCAACCDDESVTGPVRLFQPYKRRKRELGPEIPTVVKKKSISGPSKSPVQDSPTKASEALVFSLASGMMQPLKVAADGAEAANATIQIMTADPSGNYSEHAVAVMSAPQPTPTPRATASLLQQQQQANPSRVATSVASASFTKPTLDAQEQKRWWQLEEMATSLVQQAQQLKELVEQTKQQSIASKEASMTQLRQTLEKEKAEALAAVRIEAQLNLSRAVMEERSQKDIAVQQALAQARAELQEKMDSVTVVSDDKQVFTVTFAANPQGTQAASMDNIMEADGDESDRDKE